MNKSNEASISLNEQQANRLIQIFHPSFNASLSQASTKSSEEAIVWQPVLLDWHEQIVHKLNPVLVENLHHAGDISPTPSLTLMGIPVPATSASQQTGSVLTPALTDELTVTPKPTL